MKFRSVQQLAEDQRNLFFDDARAVILHANFVAVFAGLLDVDPQLGQDAGFFAGIERIIDGFFDRGQQCFARIVEAQQVAILGKEFADRNIALRRGHRLGRGTVAARLAGRLFGFQLGDVVNFVGRRFTPARRHWSHGRCSHGRFSRQRRSLGLPASFQRLAADLAGLRLVFVWCESR